MCSQLKQSKPETDQITFAEGWCGDINYEITIKLEQTIGAHFANDVDGRPEYRKLLCIIAF